MATSTTPEKDPGTTESTTPTAPANPAQTEPPAAPETPETETVKAAPKTRSKAKPTPATTTLDSDVTKPSQTAPGDGPADTTDPEERAQSVTPQPGAQALAEGTVNAVKPMAKPRAKAATKKERIETYPAHLPDGTEVTVQRNIDTGATEILAAES